VRPTASAALAAAVLLALGGCSSDDGSDGSPASQAPTSPGAAGLTLTIEQFAYSPTPLTVAPGAVISVTNKDAQEHTVTSDKDKLFKADEIKKGTPVTFTAPATAGTYTFFCDYHPRMHGTLIVR
jgi:plastocyanin